MYVQYTYTRAHASSVSTDWKDISWAGFGELEEKKLSFIDKWQMLEGTGFLCLVDYAVLSCLNLSHIRKAGTGLQKTPLNYRRDTAFNEPCRLLLKINGKKKLFLSSNWVWQTIFAFCVQRKVDGKGHQHGPRQLRGAFWKVLFILQGLKFCLAAFSCAWGHGVGILFPVFVWFVSLLLFVELFYFALRIPLYQDCKNEVSNYVC